MNNYEDPIAEYIEASAQGICTAYIVIANIERINGDQTFWVTTLLQPGKLLFRSKLLFPAPVLQPGQPLRGVQLLFPVRVLQSGKLLLRGKLLLPATVL